MGSMILNISPSNEFVKPMVGKIIATCGHELVDDDDGTCVRLAGEECDAIDGFHKSVSYVTYCQLCAERAKSWPEYLPDEDAVDKYFVEE